MTATMPFVHAAGSDTEHEAAASIVEHAKTVRARVSGLLAQAPDGLTDDEGAALYSLTYSLRADRLTFGRRRHELVQLGLVTDSGRRRPTPSGRRAIVWVAS